MLLALLTACALGLVTSQHQARKLFAEIEREQERAKQFDVEWGELQLEQSTCAMHAPLEKNPPAIRASSGRERHSGRRSASTGLAA